ncbi:MAG: hypothetical protein WA087_04315 [Candidatus Saccharimonadales bacterium]
MVGGRNNKNITTVGKIYVGILLTIFGGIVLHAPLIVSLGTLFPDYELLIKSWKEILMLVAGVMALILMYQRKRYGILRDPIMIAIAVYAVLHLVLLAWKPTGLASAVAGLAIDLRYILYFGLVYIAISLYPQYKKTFVKVGIVGAAVVLVFALLQVFVLPADILKYIGYNVDTISPYLTVDQNEAFIRINSTLRGPNPLGAYAGLVLALIIAAFAKHQVKKENWPLILTAILSAGGVVALWASYSRSALIGAAVAIVFVLVVTFAKHRKQINKWMISGGVLLTIVGGLFAVNNTAFLSNVLLHENPNEGNSINSNEDHAKSLVNGLNRAIQQPLGSGIGSTGSASLFSDGPLIIENQYLMTAHEAGWLGLGLFIYIFVMILIRLWQKRADWFALGILAGGISIAIIGLLLPVWVDDTISIIWWGLAGLVCGSWYIVDGKKEKI